MTELEQFLEAVRQERNAFAEAVNSVTWSTKMRTQAESLLIIYDQMAERLEGRFVDEKTDEVVWKEKYFTLLDKWKNFKPVDDDTI